MNIENLVDDILADRVAIVDLDTEQMEALVDTAPTISSQGEIFTASTIPAIAAIKKEIKEATFTESALANPDATRRTGPIRWVSVPRTPSE